MSLGNESGPVVSLILVSYATMRALLENDLPRASNLAGIELPPFFLTQEWLWRYRVQQIERDPGSAPWLVRAIVAEPDQAVIGHAGFHGPPDEKGMVEIGYTVLPEYRRRGFGRAAAMALIRHAEAAPGVRIVRASISPNNEASLALVRPLGFVHVGEQWDDEDGRELIFELTLPGRDAGDDEAG